VIFLLPSTFLMSGVGYLNVMSVRPFTGNASDESPILPAYPGDPDTSPSIKLLPSAAVGIRAGRV
jgi:hypothetical protein